MKWRTFGVLGGLPCFECLPMDHCVGVRVRGARKPLPQYQVLFFHYLIQKAFNINYGCDVQVSLIQLQAHGL